MKKLIQLFKENIQNINWVSIPVVALLISWLHTLTIGNRPFWKLFLFYSIGLFIADVLFGHIDLRIYSKRFGKRKIGG